MNGGAEVLNAFSGETVEVPADINQSSEAHNAFEFDKSVEVCADGKGSMEAWMQKDTLGLQFRDSDLVSRPEEMVKETDRVCDKKPVFISPRTEEISHGLSDMDHEQTVCNGDETLAELNAANERADNYTVNIKEKLLKFGTAI